MAKIMACQLLVCYLFLVLCTASDAVNRQQRQPGEVDNVAFYALLSNFTIHGVNHQEIKFENVITNIGNGYDSSTGLFTAPVSGVYVFSATLMSDPGHFNKYTVAKNGAAFANIVTDARGTAYSTTTHDFVLYLEEGDTVGIKLNDADGFVHGHNHSSFSGFLQSLASQPLASVVGK